MSMPEGLLVGGGNGIQQIAAWWQEAEAAARLGQLPRARRFLRWILACYPKDEEAWLWLARLASSQDAQLIYLRQAYSFHPNSRRVQAALRKARHQQLKMAVGELRGGRSVLHFLPDERRRSNGKLAGRGSSGANGRTNGRQTGTGDASYAEHLPPALGKGRTG